MGVLDWELASLGHPVADLAYNAIVYLFPCTQPMTPGLAGLNLAKMGIPSLQEYIAAYARNAKLEGPVKHFEYYVALSLFRISAITQGVYARSKLGNASSANAQGFGKAATELATIALEVLEGKRKLIEVNYDDRTTPAALALQPFPFGPNFWELRAKVAKFIEEEIAPLEHAFEEQHHR